MTVDSAQDLAVFFDTNDFGIAATYNGSATVNGVFDLDYFEVGGSGGVSVEGTQPRFTCAASDVSGVAHGDTLLINGVTYKVVGIAPDGTGVVNLLLEDQS